MTITDIIAAIGCLTGAVSLGVSIYQVYLSKPKIKLQTHPFHLNGFIENHDKCWSCHDVLLISLRIMNAKAVPVSINSISIYYKDASIGKNYRMNGSQLYKLPFVSFKHDDKSVVYLLSPLKSMPLRLDAMETRDVSLTIPDVGTLRTIYDKRGNADMEIEVRVHTTVKTISHNVIIYSVNNYSDIIDFVGRHPEMAGDIDTGLFEETINESNKRDKAKP